MPSVYKVDTNNFEIVFGEDDKLAGGFDAIMLTGFNPELLKCVRCHCDVLQ